MTNEETIEILSSLAAHLFIPEQQKEVNAIDKAIETLKKQDTTGDLISREALLEELEKEVKLADDWKTAHELFNVVKYFPTVEARQKGEWIPVSERLPEEGKSVLVCLQTQGGMAQFVSERFNDNCWSALGGRMPLAWQPLPKPYEEVKQ